MSECNGGNPFIISFDNKFKPPRLRCPNALWETIIGGQGVQDVVPKGYEKPQDEASLTKNQRNAWRRMSRMIEVLFRPSIQAWMLTYSKR